MIILLFVIPQNINQREQESLVGLFFLRQSHFLRFVQCLRAVRFKYCLQALLKYKCYIKNHIIFSVNKYYFRTSSQVFSLPSSVPRRAIVLQHLQHMCVCVCMHDTFSLQASLLTLGSLQLTPAPVYSPCALGRTAYLVQEYLASLSFPSALVLFTHAFPH